MGEWAILETNYSSVCQLSVVASTQKKGIFDVKSTPLTKLLKSHAFTILA